MHAFPCCSPVPSRRWNIEACALGDVPSLELLACAHAQAGFCERHTLHVFEAVPCGPLRHRHVFCCLLLL